MFVDIIKELESCLLKRNMDIMEIMRKIIFSLFGIFCFLGIKK